MSISGISSGAGMFGVSTHNKATGATSDFMNFMQMTPEQRLQEAWLAKHGISKEEFDAMSPEEQTALLEKMKQELKEALEAKVKQETKPEGATLDIFA